MIYKSHFFRQVKDFPAVLNTRREVIDMVTKLVLHLRKQ